MDVPLLLVLLIAVSSVMLGILWLRVDVLKLRDELRKATQPTFVVREGKPHEEHEPETPFGRIGRVINRNYNWLEENSGRATIVSDGTPMGTVVYVGTQRLDGVVKVEWKTSGRALKAVATLTLRDVPVDLVAELAAADLRTAKTSQAAQDE